MERELLVQTVGRRREALRRRHSLPFTEASNGDSDAAVDPLRKLRARPGAHAFDDTRLRKREEVQRRRAEPGLELRGGCADACEREAVGLDEVVPAYHIPRGMLGQLGLY